MDIQTVFRIIEMLDNRIKIVQDLLDSTGDYGALEAKYELESFQQHLQDYIDNQVAHMETEMGM